MKLARWIALLWTLLILIGCWLPAESLTIKERRDGSLWGLNIPHLDKAVHFVMFSGFAVLWIFAQPAGIRARNIILVGVGLALLTEAVQGTSWVGRDAGWDDVAADLVGLGAGAFFMTLTPTSRIRSFFERGLSRPPAILSAHQESSA